MAGRIAGRAIEAQVRARREEVRRLMDAALAVMRERGTSGPPRVADIVARAGSSNEAFYRLFGSKEGLVAALLEDGTERLTLGLRRRMDAATGPSAQLAVWVGGILSQAVDDGVAATTRAVMWNARSGTDAAGFGHDEATARLAELIVVALTELGSPEPALDARLAAHLAIGRLSDHLSAGTSPDRAEIDRITAWIHPPGLVPT